MKKTIITAFVVAMMAGSPVCATLLKEDAPHAKKHNEIAVGTTGVSYQKEMYFNSKNSFLAETGIKELRRSISPMDMKWNSDQYTQYNLVTAAIETQKYTLWSRFSPLLSWVGQISWIRQTFVSWFYR